MKLKNKYIIALISIFVPVIVALLFFTTQETATLSWVHQLPEFNAIINGSTAVILIIAFIKIKQGNRKLHERLMKLAFILGLLFLISYITYHASVPSTKFGDTNHDGVLQAMEKQQVGGMRTFYLGLLLSHIIAAVAALPFILAAFMYALKQQFDKHRRWVKFAFPLWMYVSVTGVLVYILIQPYY